MLQFSMDSKNIQLVQSNYQNKIGLWGLDFTQKFNLKNTGSEEFILFLKKNLNQKID